MENCVIKLLETGSEEDVHRLLNEFNIRYEDQFCPVGLSKDIYKRLWKLVLNLLCDSTAKSVHLSCLKTLRILSRDKSAFNEVIESDNLKVIVRLAGLVSEEEAIEQLNHQINYDVVMEAQKCLSNMLYNSFTVQQLCCTNSCIPGLMCRLKTFRDPDLPSKVKCFDMRILFLLTAFCTDIRPSLRTDYHCLTYLIEVLDEILKAEQEVSSSLSLRRRRRDVVVFGDEDIDLLVSVCKALYNLVLHVDRSSPDEEEEGHCARLTAILRQFLLAQGASQERTEELHSNTVNLLIVVPPKLYSELVQPMPKYDSTSSAAGFCGAIGGVPPEPDYIAEYDGRDMSPVLKLLEFLHRRLKNPGLSATESLTPILTLLVEMTQSNRVTRKFIRLKVLPPLRDVTKRPEEGEGIRNKLCLLMTSPMPDLKYLSANLLFILCKESVDRLIKYTGYGNAAGLLASRGLMLNRRTRRKRRRRTEEGGVEGEEEEEEEYSTDSDDSDTEEYEKMKDKVNPVTGRYEPPRPSPLDGMTEEQKEDEAMKLVNAIERLRMSNFIQPCRVGADGRPQPLESVLQLQEAEAEGEEGHRRRRGQDTDDED